MTRVCLMYSLIEADHYINTHVLVIGGGDSAVEAAMGLAQQRGNRTTLSYRQPSFSRIKERNAKRLERCIADGTITVVFNSKPVEFTPDAVVLDVMGEPRRLKNDFDVIGALCAHPAWSATLMIVTD